MMAVDSPDTLVIKPSRMKVGREYIMRLGKIFVVTQKTANGNIVFWCMDTDSGDL